MATERLTPVRYLHGSRNGPITIWTDDIRDPEQAEAVAMVDPEAPPAQQEPEAQDPPRIEQQAVADPTESVKLDYQPDVERALTPTQEKMARVRAGKSAKPRVSGTTPADDEIF